MYMIDYRKNAKSVKPTIGLLLNGKSELSRAIAIGVLAFDGQLSKTGKHAYNHSLEVMLDSYLINDTQRAAAALHDVFEDTNTTDDDLRAFGISERVIEIVKILTHRKGESYVDYIYRVKQDSDATRIKIEDISNNMSYERQKGLPKETKDRMNSKYVMAIKILTNAVG
jgi:(p)ppGpp synthase/HD superfamily hydrolase